MQREVNTSRHPDTHTHTSCPSLVHFGGLTAWRDIRPFSRLLSHIQALKPPSLSKLNIQFYWNITFSYFQWSIVAAVAAAAVCCCHEIALVLFMELKLQLRENYTIFFEIIPLARVCDRHHEDCGCGKVNTNKCREMPIHNLRFLRTQTAVTPLPCIVWARFVAGECVFSFFS